MRASRILTALAEAGDAAAPGTAADRVQVVVVFVGLTI
jgi:hypothetical protein